MILDGRGSPASSQWTRQERQPHWRLSSQPPLRLSSRPPVLKLSARGVLTASIKPPRGPDLSALGGPLFSSCFASFSSVFKRHKESKPRWGRFFIPLSAPLLEPKHHEMSWQNFSHGQVAAHAKGRVG